MNNIIFLDGGMGTMLQEAGLKPGEHPEEFGYNNPQIVKEVHKKYLKAGSDVLYANTFGANSHKLRGCNIDTKTAVFSGIKIAKEAIKEFKSEIKKEDNDLGQKSNKGQRVALDVGPIGELLEPLGTLSFEEAYEVYKEVMVAGKDAGADVIVIETFTDLLDAKAAVLAAKENTDLPVWVTMTFEESGRTFTGTTVESMALTMTGLGVDGIGVNCSLGPKEILKFAKILKEWTNLPIIIKPNAGLPDPATGEYMLKADDFGTEMLEYLPLEVDILGGCCGTNPQYIKSLVDKVYGYKKENSVDNSVDNSVGKEVETSTIKNGVCSSTNVSRFGGVRVIGERLNPTGKKRFKQALVEHDYEYICRVALDEEEAGADILDVNVGVPGADEKSLMVDVIKELQGIVSIPLQIDSSNPDVIEAALRVYAGKPIINSVNADDEKLEAILPLAKKYGAAIIGLALDESGIPQTAEGRFEKAKYIMDKALAYGIKKDDILIDCLTLTVSAQQNQAKETLKAVNMVKEQLGLHCTLGVSNISFGLPARKHITENFLVQAMYCGLDFPIINPNVLSLMDAVASFKVLSCEDDNCNNYISRFSDRVETVTISNQNGTKNVNDKNSKSSENNGDRSNGKEKVEDSKDSEESPIKTAVLKGLAEETKRLAVELLEEKTEIEVINEFLIPALDEVGVLYEKQKIFLPQLINSANAACAAFDMIKDRIANRGGESVSKGKIIVATVKGDIHDIGKNIVKVILENYGYKIIDLGRDVPVEKVVDTVLAEDVKLVGLSALMTTTLPAMKETIVEVKKVAPNCKIWVGGAVLTPDYAKEIGADFYARDARESVDIAKKILG